MAERIRGRKGQALRRRRLARTNGLCEDCKAKGKITVATIVDHTIPLAHGGEDVDENTRNLCDHCNQKRTAEQFGHRQTVGTDEDGWPIGRGAADASRA
ncbi:HNH endonuclease signature motif containing protein [Sphingomicrobium sp. XHP0239]|uniref:HNH endonuclease signature motif containing protein n=1 Tax=Sphingomicrobium maritimum TaxID=3133972 RepID=UPI0031CC913C